jgi:pimeloyl-ACP methyl ester carboxylesterase
MPTRNIELDPIGSVPVTFSDLGTGRPFLLLHGGAGPQSVSGFADTLAAAAPGRVIMPVHPGFGGTPRPAGLTSAAGLAALYGRLLEDLHVDGVTVVGNSVGGWIAAEMAVTGSARVTAVTLVDAVGIEVPGHPLADFFSLTLDQVAELAYHDPARFRIDPSAMSAEQQAAMAANRAALAVYAGTAMSDPGLTARLAEVTLPVLAIWGDSDRIADPDYGRAFAAAIPGARFRLLPATGHLPQLESPDQLLAAIRDFASAPAAGSAGDRERAGVGGAS